jgi:hypothetical protein
MQTFKELIISIFSIRSCNSISSYLQFRTVSANILISMLFFSETKIEGTAFVLRFRIQTKPNSQYQLILLNQTETSKTFQEFKI